MSDQIRTVVLAIGLSVLLFGCGRRQPPQLQVDSKSAGEKAGGKPSSQAGTSVKPASASSPTTVTTSPADSAKPPSTVKSSDPPTSPVSPVAPQPQQVFRPDDQRSARNDQMLDQLGIRRFDSTRLILYTDIDPQVAATLPPVIDQAYAALTDYFGPLPPNRARTEFQMTGYLIKDEARFREAGLIPENLPPFEHGRHRHNEFWMREQKYDYYRRHLLIHEVTHCFMTVMPDVEAPVWYMEGMAEYFGTHRLNADGKVTFCVMPTSPEEFAGSGRITAIRNDYSAGRGKTIPSILDLTPIEFLKTEHYAWSWALATFLDTHPRYRQRFRELGGYLQRNAFATQFFRAFSPDTRDLATEWTLFVQNLQYGYDATRAAIDFVPGTELTEQRLQQKCEIQADRGWQSSGVLVRAGQSYELTATGRFELANDPKPWISEPQGISFRYFGGRPLGQLIGGIRTETGEVGGSDETMLKTESIGRGGAFQAPTTGTLYLRLNDEWNSLHDNRGHVTVEIRSANPSR